MHCCWSATGGLPFLLPLLSPKLGAHSLQFPRYRKTRGICIVIEIVGYFCWYLHLNMHWYLYYLGKHFEIAYIEDLHLSCPLLQNWLNLS
ncbi:hypothetical protein CEXT_745231 [Caerostris extrusa]|uniref:Uncharacterized protein n=1 Tax=Caerostris extrusa TaxID=172846 RepID=A0AAV4R6E5_CAEEX|nr:hypothetical protein CEXT_745231 [Caerostris extrusa]